MFNKQIASNNHANFFNNDALMSAYENVYKGFTTITPDSKGLYFEQEKITDMLTNLPLNSMKQRTPGECNVLTTYFHLYNEKINDYFDKIVDEVKKALPENFDYYAPSRELRHISLVMIHDVRPKDLNNPDIVNSINQPDAIKNIVNEINTLKFSAFNIKLEGIRIMPKDGAVIAVFSDEGGKMQNLRQIIGKPLAEQKYLIKDALQYDKNFVHVTLFRPLKQINAETLEKLKTFQETYKVTKPLTEKLTHFFIGLETQWNHAKVEQLGKYEMEK